MALEEVKTSDRSQHWLDEIERYQKASQKWREDAKKIIDRYRLERSNMQSQGRSSSRPTFNILWSNIQTMKPALFARIPEIIAERRHRDRDPVGRIASEVIQRAANEEIERNGFKDAMDQVVLDVLLVGRGVPWVRFEADETADGIADEKIMLDYVHWDDFAHSPERNWAAVERRGWVARRTLLTRAEGKKRFKDGFSKVPMSTSSRTSETLSQRERDGSKDKYAEVWEIWDAVSRKRIFVAKGADDVLESKDPQYELTGFFPCPRPAYATLTNEDLIPIPDYKQYIDLADELDTISGRIRKLTQALQFKGLYDAAAEEVGRLLEPGEDGKMLAVTNFSALVGKSVAAGGGLEGVVQFLPMDVIAQTLVGLYQARDQAKNTLYEMSGISDIVRGQVDPREKASQSKIKAQFATQRLDQRRRAVERTARDAARIQVELMVELYSPDTIRQQSGFDLMREVEGMEPAQPGQPDPKEQVWEAVIQLLQSDHARGFRVDVETDSTIEMDAGQTQEARTEFLTSAGNFLNNALPVMQSSPDLTPLMGEMMLFAVRGYRAGRTLESAFEEAVQDIKERLEQQQQAEQQQQGPPPDPAAEAEAAKIQQQAQIEGAKGQAQVESLQQKGQVEAQKGQIEAQKGQLELAQQQAELQHMVQTQALELEKLKAQIKAVGQRQTVQ